MGGMKSAIKPPPEGGTSYISKWKVSTSKEVHSLVTVKIAFQKLGTLIKTIRGVEGPWGVAVNQRF